MRAIVLFGIENMVRFFLFLLLFVCLLLFFFVLFFFFWGGGGREVSSPAISLGFTIFG